MSIKIIQQKSESLVTVNNDLDRRRFLKQSSAIVLLPFLSLTPYKDANAFLPILVAVAKFTAYRLSVKFAGNVGRSAGKKLLSQGTKAGVSQNGKKVAQVGLFSSFAPEILAAAAEAGTDVIWAKSGYYNDLSISVENKTEDPINTPMTIVLKDSKTGEVEMSKPFILLVKPLQRATFDIQIRDLPNIGVKQVVGVVENKNIIIQPSDKIVIATASQIYS